MSKAETPIRKPQTSPWAVPIGEVSGISIRIHLTFLLFLAWIGATEGTSGALFWVGFIVVLFACVLLHELGHALTAKRFGIQTRSITLYPIGGVAMLEGRPKPKEEFWIALAGPMVNVAIAGILGVIILAQEGHFTWIVDLKAPNAFLNQLFVSNLLLAGFNLIPAFPMDGGRVLRAALGMSMPEQRATQIAAGVGQSLAFMFGFYAILSGNLLWFVIAAFVFFGASQEYSSTITRSLLEGHLLREAMVVRYQTLPSGASLDEAAKILLEGLQHDFPVAVGEEVVGLLTRNDIARGLASDGPSGFVAGHMSRDFKTASPDLPLEKGVELFAAGDTTPILVMEGEGLVGMVTQENVSEFIMLAHARSQGAR